MALPLLSLPIAVVGQSADKTPSGPNTPSAANNAAFSRTSPTGPGGASAIPAGDDLQPVNDSPNTPPSFYASSPSAATSSVGTPPFAAAGPSMRSTAPSNYPFQWGPFSALPHFAYDFTYASGVLARPGQPTDTALNNISPGVLVLSRHVSVDYTPTIAVYSKGPYQDYLNHSASLSAGFGYNDWSFQIQQGYTKNNYPLIETGIQTETETFSTELSAAWNYSQKLFFNFSLSQQFQSAASLQSYKQWSTMDWINYRLTEHLSVGAGLGGGYSSVDTGSNSIYEQIQGRVNWRPSEKLTLGVNGGVEIREFTNLPGSSELVNPLMGADVSYHVFEPTFLTFTANRSVGNSILPGNLQEAASVSGGISQRLLGHYTLDLSVGYRSTDYKSTLRFFGHSLELLRQEDYTFVSVGLRTTFLRKGTVSVGYLHGDNESTLRAYQYASDQFSFRLGYRY